MWPAVCAADETTAVEQSAVEPAPSAARAAASANAANSGRRAAEESRPSATPEEIAAWIAQLDDNRYLVREQATRQLLEAGQAALDPLLAVANADRPEPADRAVWVLRRNANSNEPAVRRQALELLVQLQNRPTVAAAAREALAQIRHDEAVEAIQQLGGRFTSPYVEALRPYMAGRVVIDHTWRGGDAGLVYLRHLIGLSHVIVVGTDISLAGLRELQHVPDLQDLWLYGTKLQPAEVPEIQSLLPQVIIDYRRGGLLGVRSSSPDPDAPAVVGSVEGVAAAAGIQAGDLIQKFENQPVPNFKALTVMIGDRMAGDEVTLEVLRGGQPIEFKLKLGQWETFNF